MSKYLILISLLSLAGYINTLYSKGLTWGLASHDISLNVDRVSCGGVCNAYQGDTSCSTKLPILCYSKSLFKRPPYNVAPCSGCAMTKEFYDGWTEGYFILTEPILGTSLINVTNMINLCSTRFGSTFTVATHHMGKHVVGMSSTSYFYSTWPSSTPTGGWGARGYGNIGNSTRFWVYIRDQPANCWN